MINHIHLPEILAFHQQEQQRFHQLRALHRDRALRGQRGSNAFVHLVEYTAAFVQ